MEFQPAFQIHEADPMYFVESPIIITTTHTNTGGYPKGEWFLVVPEENGKLIAQATRFDFKTFPEGPVKFDTEFMLNEMLTRAKLRLRRYVLDTKGPSSLEFLSTQVRTTPADGNLLMGYWMREVFCESLITIRGKTESSPLAELLHWITGLPHFSSREIK